MHMKNYYEILGVDINATQEQIKSKFRYLAFVYHPDRFSDSQHKLQAEEDFKHVNEAYSVLSNPQKRAEYDITHRDYTEPKSPLHEENERSPKITREYVQFLMTQASPLKKIDLSNLDLSWIDLSNIYVKNVLGLIFVFNNSNLYRANLSGNAFIQAEFCGANLQDLNISSSMLLHCDFKGANISATNFSRCNLSYTSGSVGVSISIIKRER